MSDIDHDKESDKNLVTRLSRVGELLKVVRPSLSDEDIAHAEATKHRDQPLGARLFELGHVTAYDISKVLEIQENARAAGPRGLEVLMGFRDEGDEAEQRARAAVFAALPPTDHGS